MSSWHGYQTLLGFWQSAWPDTDPKKQQKFNLLMAAYDNGRHYHTTEHLLECFSAWEEVSHHPKIAGKVDERAVVLSVFYHDCLYNIRAIDNEAKSVDAWSEDAKGVFDRELVAKVGRAILATGQLLGYQAYADAPIEALLLCDLDLSFFARATTERIVAYEHQIWLEYRDAEARSDHSQLEPGYYYQRIRVIKRILQQQPLFHLISEWEQAAHISLAYLLGRVEERATRSLGI